MVQEQDQPLNLAMHTQVVPLKTVGNLSASGDALDVTHHLMVYIPPTEVEYHHLTARMLRRVLKLTKGTPDTAVFRKHTLGFVAMADRKLRLTAHIGTQSFTLPKAKRNSQVRMVTSLSLNQLVSDGLLPSSPPFSDQDRLTIPIRYQVEGQTICQSNALVLANKGLSLVSDIDDTVKLSFVEDRKEMLSRTFLRPFEAVEGMSAVYQTIASQFQASVHYVSSSPWQLYEPLESFLKEQKFPVDSIHLRKFTLKDVTLPKKFSPAAKRKRAAIENFLVQFPNRQVILVGDSGEKDPEIYGDIARKFPQQIALIAIRNLKNEQITDFRYEHAWLQVEPSRQLLFDQPDELLNRLEELQNPHE